MPIEKLEVKVKDLLFDPDNPRLPQVAGKEQKEIFRFLVDEIGIDDVLQSIAASGLIEGDPIIARPSGTAGQYYVVEGNRRLAALKLLSGEKIGDTAAEPAVPEMSDAARRSIASVRIQTGWRDDDLETYLGQKHVTSTREWTPEAKARFVIGRVGDDFSAQRLSVFAKRLGTNLPTLRRWVVAYLTLQQAQRQGEFDPKETYAKRYFGTFYTLLDGEPVQSFLGLVSDPITKDPVPNDHLKELKELVAWTIGRKTSPPVVNSRKQKELNAVLSSPSALKHFRLRRDLDAALLYTEYNAKEISSKLLNAAYGIEECLPKLHDVRDDPEVLAAIENIDAAYEKLKINAAPKPAKKS